MAKDLSGKGVFVLTVNGGDNAQTISKFWQSGHLTLPVAMDPGKVEKLYGVQAIPTNYVIDGHGKILGAFEGFDEAGIRQALAKAGIK